MWIIYHKNPGINSERIIMDLFRLKEDRGATKYRDWTKSITIYHVDTKDNESMREYKNTWKFGKWNV